MFHNALIVKMNENVCHDTALILESLDDVIKYMLECNYNIFTKNHDVFIIYFERTIWCITKLSNKFVDIFMFKHQKKTLNVEQITFLFNFFYLLYISNTPLYEICLIFRIIYICRLPFCLKPITDIKCIHSQNECVLKMT